MNINYSILFTIELLHEYFFDRKCKGMAMVPADDSRGISKNMNTLFRNNDNRLIALIRQNDNGEPFLNDDANKIFRSTYANKVFRFYLKINDVSFFNYTNVPALTGANRKFYFSNLSNNKQNDRLYLSTPVPEYDAAKTYLPGDLVMEAATGKVFEAIKTPDKGKKTKLTDDTMWALKGLSFTGENAEDYAPGKTYAIGDVVTQADTGNVYEAIKKHSSKNAKELTDAQLWIARGQGELQYPTVNDMIECCGDQYVFNLPAAAKKADITITGYNFNTKKPAYDAVVLKETKSFQSAVTQVNIGLSALAPGRYDIKVNDETRTIYHDPMMNGANILGVIEIYHHLDDKNDFSLLTKDEKIKHVKYDIVFPNRRVLWKYVRKDGRAKTITDIGDTGYAFTLNGEEFVSNTPIPLSENILKTLKLDFSSKDFSVSPLPNPPIQRLCRYTQNGHDYLCSEIYLNY